MKVDFKEAIRLVVVALFLGMGVLLLGMNNSSSALEVRVSDEWNTPQALPAPVNTAKWEDGARISSDGKILYYTIGEGREVYTYMAKKTQDGWGNPEELDFNLKSFPTGAPHTMDGKTLYFSSIRPGGFGLGDIYVTHYIDGKWSEAENLGRPVNTESMESDPVISADGNILYFASTRPEGKGSADIWMTRKTQAGWSQPVNLGAPVNTELEEMQPFVTEDGSELYFCAVNRNGIPGPAIFRSIRFGDKWLEPELVISGFVGEPSVTKDKQLLYFVHLIHKGNKLVDADIMVSQRK